MNGTWYVKKKRIPGSRNTTKNRQACGENNTYIEWTTVLFAEHIEAIGFNKRTKACPVRRGKEHSAS